MEVTTEPIGLRESGARGSAIRGSSAPPGIAEARAAGRDRLTEPEAKALLSSLGIAVPRGGVAAEPSEVAAIASGLAPPLVVKVVSPDIVHKSDIGGVLRDVQIRDAPAAARAVLESARRAQAGAHLLGILVEEQIQGGIECIAGLVGASPLGPAVMFGLGGVLVEVLEDVAFRLAPLDGSDAAAMLDEVKGARLLRGYRGAPAADRGALTRVLLRLGDLAAAGALAELDINPLLALPNGAVALDARATLRPSPAGGRTT